MAHLEISLLGSCSVRLDEKPIHGFASDKVRMLLAYLAVEAGHPQPRERLVEIFWPERAPKLALGSLRSALSNLRQLLNDNPNSNSFLEITREFVQFNSKSDHWLDVNVFEERFAEAESLLAHSDDLPSAMVLYQSAIETYHAGFLEGFTLKDCPEFDDWCYFVRERLLHKATTALSRLASYQESRCEYPAAIRFARRRVELEPWQEEAYVHLMRLLALDGKISEALEQFQVCCQRLRAELDVEPSADTIKLYESIRTGKFTQPKPATARTPLLPAYLIPLVGRQIELDEIAARLNDPVCRLLTLLGPGGCGKTRLAVETASRLATRFPNGVCFVPLVAVDKIGAIVPSILRALGVTTPSADLHQALISFLQHKQLLLVLDNYEQLLLEGSEILPELLSQAPGIKLLVTSRERLHLVSEQIYPVEGLSLPPVQQSAEARSFDAIQLFSQIANRQRGYPISDEELKEVLHICRLVGGLPLAIEIAASWTKALSCAEITAEIEQSLGFLQSDTRELQARHRSVQAVFEATWQRLTVEEQAAFRKLSVFRGGFTRQAFEAVTGGSLRLLTSLVDQCLVSHRPSGRYELHELMRQFAEEKLGQDCSEKMSVVQLHSHFYLELIQSMDFVGLSMAEHLEKTEADIDNLRAAWLYAASKGDYPALEASYLDLFDFFSIKVRYAEARALRQETMSILPGDPPEPFLARMLLGIGTRQLSSIEVDRAARENLEKSLEISTRLGRKDLIAGNLRSSAEIYWRDDFPQALQLFEKAIALLRELDELRMIAQEIWWKASLLYAKGFISQSETCYHICLEFCQESQNLSFEMLSVYMLGFTSLVKGELETGSNWCKKLGEIVPKQGVPGCKAYLITNLALEAWRKGCFSKSKTLFEQGLQVLQDCADLGDTGWLPLKVHLQLVYCQMLDDEGAYEEMHCQALQALELYPQAGFYTEWGDPWVEPVEWLARAEMHLGDFTSARQHLVQFIQDCLSNRYTDWALFGLYFYAELLVKEKPSPERKILALELLSFVRYHPRLEGIDYHPAIFGKPALPSIESHAERLAAELPAQEAAAARERGRHLVLEEVVQELVAGRGRYYPL